MVHGVEYQRDLPLDRHDVKSDPMTTRRVLTGFTVETRGADGLFRIAYTTCKFGQVEI